MSLDAVKRALDELSEPTCCSGAYRAQERVAIALPDGDVGAIDDPRFVEWLVEHGEPAPFGHGKETKQDKSVRDATRLKARGAATIAGFEPESVLGEIEAALSPRTHLAAKLTDVVIYTEGGKFHRHKDTPRSPDLVGTLVVGLPIEHRGGALVVGEESFDWGGPPTAGTLRWVALFGDVDHEVKPVVSGARVTLVYALTQTDRPREDPSWEARRAKLRAAIAPLANRAEWPVMIACTRHVITGTPQPQKADILRGRDRELADVLVEAGYHVTVRACIGSAEGEPEAFPSQLNSAYGLTKPLTASDLGEVVAFEANVEDDEGNDLSDYSIAEHLNDDGYLNRWVIRKNAVATLLAEALASDTGYFGNEAYMALLYSLAALEVSPTN